MSEQPCPMVLLGSGGHAAHLIAIAAAGSSLRVVACRDDDVRRVGSEVLGVPVSGSIAQLGRELPNGAEAIGLAIGDPRVREGLMALSRVQGWALPVIVHPAATVACSASVGAGSVLDAGAVIGARAVIGAAAIIEAGVSVAHDACVGDLVHVEAGARILPGATIGRRARIGAGAVVARQVVVADDAVIAPLSLVVVSHVPSAKG